MRKATVPMLRGDRRFLSVGFSAGRRIVEGKDRGSWTAWLTAVARNTALDYARGQARRHIVGQVEEHMPSPEPTPEEAVLLRERQEAVRRALERLPGSHRALFYRKYYYRQSTAQIAAELGLSQRAVEGRLYRLKKRLRTLLGGEEHG